MKRNTATIWLRNIFFLSLLSLSVFFGNFLYTGITSEYSIGGGENLQITPGEEIAWNFSPDSTRLTNVYITVIDKSEASDTSVDSQGVFVFQLLEAASSKQLYEEKTALSQIVENWYLDLPVKKKISMQKEYCIKMFLEDASANNYISLETIASFQYDVIVPIRVVLFLIIVAVVILIHLYLITGEKNNRKKISIREVLEIRILKQEYSLLHVGMFFIVTIGALVLRFRFLPFKSNDYYLCYEDWIREIRQNGGLYALGHVIGNYTPLYVIIWAILSYLPWEPVVIIKLAPCIFDFITAIFSLKFLKLFDIHSIEKKVTLYALMLLNPVSFLLSSAWGQCDVIYSAFILFALYGLCQEHSDKWYTSGDGIFILFGIAFSLKLQSLFFLPVLGLMWIVQKRKRISPLQLLWLPGMYMLSCIPAAIQGRDLKKMFKIYLGQSSENYGGLSINYPNLYSLMGSQNSPLRDGLFVMGLLLAFFSLLFLYYWIYNNGYEVNAINICKITAVTILILCFFLPSIHERYSYMAEMLLVILVIAEPRYFKAAGITLLCTTLTYCTYLYELEFAFAPIPEWLIALARIWCIVFILKDIVCRQKTVTGVTDSE